MIYEARTNFADEEPLHVYTEEQLKSNYNRGQRSHIKEVLGQEKTRYGFYWKLGDEKTTESSDEKTTESSDEKTAESGNTVEMLGDEKVTEGDHTVEMLADEGATESGRTINIVTSDIPYTKEDMVDLDEPDKYLILALKPEIEEKEDGWWIRGETLRKFITEEGIEEMERRHQIEGYRIIPYEEFLARGKDQVMKDPTTHYKLSWGFYSFLRIYDIDSEGNAYSFIKYWKRCNLDKKEKVS